MYFAMPSRALPKKGIIGRLDSKVLVLVSAPKRPQTYDDPKVAYFAAAANFITLIVHYVRKSVLDPAPLNQALSHSWL